MSLPQAPAPAPATNFIPDRKVVAGGLAGIIAWAIMLGFGVAGHPLDPSLQPAIVAAVGTLVAYAVPPSKRDLVKRLNDEIVAIAADDPTVPVNPAVAAVVRKS